MAAESNKKRIVVAGIASILLVAAVVGAVVTFTSKKSSNNGSSAHSDTGASPSTSSKSVEQLCQATDYQKACQDSMSEAKTTDPSELTKVAFNATIKQIEEAIKNSTFLKSLANDEGTKGALNVCEEVLHTAIEDLQRSFEKFSGSSGSLGEYVNDVKTWVSAAITFQQTCLDAFENTTGETGEKMKQYLKNAGELTSNGLAIVTDLSKYLSGDKSSASSPEASVDGALALPPFVDPHARKLMYARASSIKPNVVVAQDGSGDFRTISAAVKTIPPKNKQTFIIHIKEGIYKEYVEIPKKVNNVVFIGDGPLKTRITGNKNFADGVKPYYQATLTVNGENFMAKYIGIENTAGPAKHQAVALRVSGDRAVFYSVHIDGFQDTLYAHAYRQFYRECTITGTIDFVFGDARAVFQNCDFVVRKPLDNQSCMVTAQGRQDRRGVGATVLQNCKIMAEPEFTAAKPVRPAYLGRPWKQYSRTIIMNSNIDGFIDPAGWHPWDGDFALDTCYYGEYQNRGPGSDLANRVRWKGIKRITPQIALRFTPEKLFEDDAWVKDAGVAYDPGMMRA